MPRKTKKVTAGDIFSLPTPDHRLGLGQVIVGGTVFYIAVFEGLFEAVPEDLATSLDRDILLVGWTTDALLHHNEWHLVGNAAPIIDRVLFPNYKVRVNGDPFVHDFSGKNYRPASSEDWEFFELKSTRAPIAFQSALHASCGLREWESRFDGITFSHVKRQAKDRLGTDSLSLRH